VNQEPPKRKPRLNRMAGKLMYAEPSSRGEGHCHRRRTGSVQPMSLRGRRGQHVGKERMAKARNHLWVAEVLLHSEGVAYNRLCREVATCLQVGRMGPSKRRWTGTT